MRMRGPQRLRLRRLRRLMRLLLWLCVVVYLTTSPFLVYFTLVQAIAVHAGSTGAPVPATAPTSQDLSWVAAKLAFRVRRPTPPGSAGSAIAPPACTDPCAHLPAAYVLDTSVVQHTLEPAKVGGDAAGHAYADHNMSNLCRPAAVATRHCFWCK